MEDKTVMTTATTTKGMKAKITRTHNVTKSNERPIGSLSLFLLQYQFVLLRYSRMIGTTMVVVPPQSDNDNDEDDEDYQLSVSV